MGILGFAAVINPFGGKHLALLKDQIEVLKGQLVEKDRIIADLGLKLAALESSLAESAGKEMALDKQLQEANARLEAEARPEFVEKAGLLFRRKEGGEGFSSVPRCVGCRSVMSVDGDSVVCHACGFRMKIPGSLAGLIAVLDLGG